MSELPEPPPTPPTTNTSEQDRLLMNRYIEAVENMFTSRTSFLTQMLDPRRDIDAECGYPQSMTGTGFGAINPELFRTLYERENLANKVVTLMPKACFQKSPMVFETEDPEVVTPFEEDWDEVGKKLRGEQCFYQDEEGSPIWNYLFRLDVLSGIGAFGCGLIGVNDGKNLDEPLDGVVSYDPTGNMAALTEFDWEKQLVKSNVTVNVRNEDGSVSQVVKERIVGVRREYKGKRVNVFPTAARALPSPSCNEREVDTFPVYENDPRTGLPVFNRREPYPDMQGVDNTAGPVPTINKIATVKEVMAPSSLQGTDAQYVGLQFSPSEFPATEPSTEKKELLFFKVFDESQVQIVQYEANTRNPRFSQPVMYRITLNDPREQHSGIGLPMATVRVHWSRIIHVSDNNGSSDIFGVPRQRPVLNRLLDARKIYASSAEGYWQNCFSKLVLSTHPTLGGDVKVNVPQLQNMLENVRNGMQKEMLLMGMGASTVTSTVADPASFINTIIEAICIQLDCPVRVFKGSERGELASSQDDDEWLDHVRFRQHNHVTPRIIVALVDRLIACGVLRTPGQEGKTPVGKRTLAGRGGQKTGSNGTAKSKDTPTGDAPPVVRSNRFQTNAFPPKGPPTTGTPAAAPPPSPKVTLPDRGKPAGYSVEWPDLDSLGDKDKAAIALQLTQAIAAYVAGGCEAIIPVFEFFVHVLGWDEELVVAILAKVQSGQEDTMTIPPPGEIGHPATPEPAPVIVAPGGKAGGKPTSASKPGTPPKAPIAPTKDEEIVG